MASAALKASDDYSDLVPNPNHKHAAAPEQNEDPEVIQFYESVGQYGCFSNFSRHAISIDNKRWPTTEHYFQAQKFSGTYHEEEIRSLETPMAAAQAGRDRSRPLRRDWEDVKDDIMYKALVAKFTQHVDCARTLLRTGDAILVEHTKNDSYWADGGNGKGKNMLGVLLMRVRKELQEHPEVKQVAAEVAAEFAADEAEDDLADVGGRTHNKIKTKKKKLRARVNIYVDKDGSSKLESANDGKGTVNVVSSGGVSLNKKALPAAAQMAVLRNQFTRRYQNNDEEAEDNGAYDEEEEEVDSEYIVKRNNKQGNKNGGNNLSNYLPGGAKAAPAPVADNSAAAIMADVRDKVDLITDCMNAKAARAQFSQIVTELYAKREELAALAASEQSDERVAAILAMLDSVDAITERMNAYAEP